MENDKNKPKKHIAIPTSSCGYIWVCPVCGTQVSGYPIEGYRCKKCNQIIDFE